MLLYSTRIGDRKFCTSSTEQTLINEWLGVSESGTWHTLLGSWPLGCWPQALAAWAVLVCVPGYYSAPPAAVSALWAAASAPLAEGVQCEKPKSREKVNWYPKQHFSKIRHTYIKILLLKKRKAHLPSASQKLWQSYTTFSPTEHFQIENEVNFWLLKPANAIKVKHSVLGTKTVEDFAGQSQFSPQTFPDMDIKLMILT